jgi:hypothetical protein
MDEKKPKTYNEIRKNAKALGIFYLVLYFVFAIPTSIMIINNVVINGLKDNILLNQDYTVARTLVLTGIIAINCLITYGIGKSVANHEHYETTRLDMQRQAEREKLKKEVKHDKE